MRLRGKETAKKFSFLKYQKLTKKGNYNKYDFLSFKNKRSTSKSSIFYQSKLHQKSIMKWRRFFAHRNYIKKVYGTNEEIHQNSRISVILTLNRRAVSVGYSIRRKLVLVSTTQICHWFNIKFRRFLTLIKWRCFSVEIQLSFQR